MSGRLFGMLLGCLAWGVSPEVVAQEVAGNARQDIEAGKRSLASGPHFPWYDSHSDSLRRVHVRPPAESALNRGSRWEEKPRAEVDVPWLRFLLEVALRVLFWTLIIAVIALLIWLLVFAFLRREVAREGQSATLDEEQAALERGRIENLPFPLRRPRTNLLEEARRHYTEGNYREAIIYYYSYLLLELDKHQVIRLTPGKTNRQYLYETRPRPNIAGILEPTMVMFEDVFFGDLPLPRERFEEAWHRLDDFQDLVQRVGA